MANTLMRLVVGATGLALVGVVVPAALADDVDQAPESSLAGAATFLDSPRSMTRGPEGKLYVANRNDESVTVYAEGASGDTAPLQRIKGANTRLNLPVDVATDSAGFIYVANSGGLLGSITVYAPDADGNTVPVREIQGATTQLNGPSGVIIDQQGRIVVASRGNKSLLTFKPSANGGAPPLRHVFGPAAGLAFPRGLTQAADGSIVVASDDDESLVVIPKDANGEVAASRVIAGTATQLDDPYDVGFDSLGNLYAVNDDGDSVTVYGPGADGNAAPIRRLVGAATGIDAPRGLLVEQDHRVTVSNALVTERVATFAPLVAPAPVATEPGAVRKLKVKRKDSAKKRPITWRAPSDDGGAVIESYILKVKKRGDALVSKTFDGDRDKFVLKRKKVRNGKHKVIVRAVNEVGKGPKRKLSFRVDQP